MPVEFNSVAPALPTPAEKPVRKSRVFLFPWPRRIRSLILAGFALVSLPLIYVVITTVVSVDQLTKVSQKALNQGIKTTQVIRAMSEDLVQMERAYRQYLVLQDEALLQRFQMAHENFARSAQSLIQTRPELEYTESVARIMKREAVLFTALSSAEVRTDIDPIVVKEFADLTGLIRQLVELSTEKVNLAVDALDTEGDQLQRSLFVKTMFIVPATLLVAFLFAVLITRPLQQLVLAIRTMGDGNLNQQVKVSGPQDLQYLGERLNWLRLQLMSLEKEKQKFLRSVSHELNTPLSAIREGTALLAEEVVGPVNEQQREVLDILRSSSLDLQRHIENLLHFNRLGVQGCELYRAEVDLQQLITNVASQHKVPMLARNLQMKLQLQPVLFNGDYEKLRIICDNLVSNAVKYSPDGGRVRLRLAQQEGAIVFSVIDEGVGISPDERSRIFELFFRGKAAREGRIKGTGLGLVIAHEYACLHGGDILIVSPVQNKKGSCFQLILPLEKQKNE